jgi:hypothetical protein
MFYSYNDVLTLLYKGIDEKKILYLINAWYIGRDKILSFQDFLI